MEISLVEGEPQLIGDMPSPDAAAIAAVRRTSAGRIGSVFRVTPASPSGYEVTSRGYVGSVVIGRHRITIEPRFPKARLLEMQRIAVAPLGNLASSIQVQGALGTEYLAASYLSLVERLLFSGIPEEYVYITERSFSPRGSIHFGSFDMSASGKIEHTRQTFSSNTSFNALLRDALEALHRLGVDRAADLLNAFSVVTCDRLAVSALIDPPGSLRHDVATLAFEVIRGSGADLGHDQSSARGFLLKVSTVFEGFLRSIVARVARRRSALEAAARVSDRTFWLDTSELYRIELDVLVLEAGMPVFGADAKYKYGDQPPSADIYQAVAYATRLNLSEFHLIYPGTGPIRSIQLPDERGVVIYQHWLDLHSPALVADADQLFDRLLA